VKIIKLSQASRPLAEYAADLDDEIVVLTSATNRWRPLCPSSGPIPSRSR
jgi:hypothetical protein